MKRTKGRSEKRRKQQKKQQKNSGINARTTRIEQKQYDDRCCMLICAICFVFPFGCCLFWFLCFCLGLFFLFSLVVFFLFFFFSYVCHCCAKNRKKQNKKRNNFLRKEQKKKNKEKNHASIVGKRNISLKENTQRFWWYIMGMTDFVETLAWKAS